MHMRVSYDTDGQINDWHILRVTWRPRVPLPGALWLIPAACGNIVMTLQTADDDQLDFVKQKKTSSG